MRVLLSAYACEPDKGSEPGVGWHWANEIEARGHEVFVLTRSNNKKAIERIDLKGKNIHFIYYDLPPFIVTLKKLIGVHFYYFLWQIGLFFFVKRRLSAIQPDIVHHITFVSIKKITFLPFLGIPFYYGPIGGGETCPYYLLKGSGVKNILKELVRDFLNNLVRFRPISMLLFRKAELIFTTTKESLLFLPKVVRSKTFVRPAIGIANTESQLDENYSLKFEDTKLRLLFVGNLLYLKGIQIAFDAFAEINLNDIDFEFTIIGDGVFKKELHEKAVKLNIQSKINWLGRVPQSKLKKYYESHDLFIFPGLHDSGGMVVLESQSFGTPVMSFDLGGPGYFNGDKMGWVINVAGKKYHEITREMSQILQHIALNRNSITSKSFFCKTSAFQHTWEKRVGQVYELIEAHHFKLFNIESTGNTL